MANNIKGITIEIGGDTTKLQTALKGVNGNIRDTQAELRETNKLLKLDPKNTEALAQKQTLLANAISEAKEKLDILKTAEAQVQEQFKKGEASEEQYRAVKREIERTTLEIRDLETAAAETEKAVKQLGDSSQLSGDNLQKAQEKAGSLKDTLGDLGEKAAAAAKALGAGFVAAATYATKFETDCDKALNTVITQTGAADTEVEGLEDTLLSIYKDNFGEDINDIAAAMSAVRQQTGQTGDELKNTTENALLMRDTFDMDVNESIRGVNAMMKQFGISSEEAYNLLAQGAQNGLNQNGDLADQLAEYSVYYADLGISAEEAFNMIANGAKNGTFQIDYLNDAVKEFGIRAKDGTSDEAFQALGLSVDDLKAKFAQGGEGAREAFQTVNQALFSCDDEVQRNLLGVELYGTKWEDLGEDAIRSLVDMQGEISTANDALGTINENKYNDIGSQIEELGRNINADLVKPIGEELQPVISDVISEVKSQIPQVKTIVLAVIDKVKEFISFVSANGSTIISIIAGIAAGFLAWNVVSMIQGIITVITSLGGILPAIATGIRAINAAMAANPIGLIVTIIATLISALITLFMTNEDFRNKVIAVWEAVKAAAAAVFGAIADFFTVTIPNAFNTFLQFAGNLVTNVTQFFQNLWNGIVAIFQGVGQWFIDRFTEAYTGVTTVFSTIGAWFAARWNDIKTALATVATWFLTIFTNAYTNVTNVFAAIGSWFGARWTEIKTALSNVATWFGTQFQNAWTNIKNAFANVTSFFSSLWEKIKGCFVNVGTAIGSAVSNAFKSAINSCLSTIEGIVNKFIGMINGVIDIINAIPGVSLGKIGTVSLPRLAKGGVLREGTAMVAEAGPELLSMVNGKAVVTPLTGTAANTAVDGLKGSGGGFHQEINITSPKALTPYEVARQTRIQTRAIAIQMQRG